VFRSIKDEKQSPYPAKRWISSNIPIKKKHIKFYKQGRDRIIPRIGAFLR
jgi:hypothetical protein